MMALEGVAGVVLAGGLSTRIGRDKGQLEIGGSPQWCRPVERLQALFSEVVYATNDPGFTAPQHDLTVTFDEVPHQGPLGGILSAFRATTSERLFVVAYDMPFIQAALARFLVELAPEADVTVPVIGGKYEPLHAVYGRGCEAIIEKQLAVGRRQIIHFYQSVRVREVSEAELRAHDSELISFFNINTWKDVEQAEALLREGH